MSDQVGGALLDMVLDLLGMDGSGSTYDGYGDAGVATLVLSLENGFTVRHSWQTDITKFRAGGEQRRSRNDTDRESYSGAAYLLSDDPREIRATLARYAPLGSIFLLGLPHEALALRTAASGTTVPVFPGPLALTDWTRPGQRVVVAHEDEDGVMQFVDAVVQSTTSNTIEIDTAIGSVGALGAVIMPAKAIHLEPQQDFERFESDAELWSIRARYAEPLDFAPQLASLALGPITSSSALDDVVLVARITGLLGNSIGVSFVEDASAPDEGSISESTFGGPPGTAVITFKGGVTTLADIAALIDTSSLVLMAGTWTGTDTLASGTGDEFTATLSGADDLGAVGTGATLEEYEDHPVWDREINVDGSIVDGVQAMTQLLDKGGVPYVLATADKPDWFRSVALAAGDREDWQWFKLFMSTVRGKQKKFWLATWREDLVYDSHSGTSLTVDADAGDFTAWWPQKRQHVQILQADNTVTYAEITAASVVGATRVLTLSESLSASAVEKISWLELCRWEDGDDFETTHDRQGFSVQLLARVVP